MLAYQAQCPVDDGEALGLWHKMQEPKEDTDIGLDVRLLNGRPVYQKMQLLGKQFCKHWILMFIWNVFSNELKVETKLSENLLVVALGIHGRQVVDF